jgi:hypothetical protein
MAASRFEEDSMRRVIGLTLAGLGAFLIATGLLVRFYVGGHLIKYPLSEYLTTSLEGKVTYFSPMLVSEIHGATMRATSTVKGNPSLGTSSTAVWDEFTYLYDTTHKATFEYDTRRFAFDRRTAELVNCCGANVNGNTAIRQSGLVGFLWPFGLQPKTYQVFDPVLNKPRPARYAGTGVIGGIRVYRFVEHVPLTRAGSQKLPASLVGMTGSGEVTLPEYYTATNTFWVDPLTGAQLNTTQDQTLTLRDATGTQRLVLLDGTLKFTPQSIQTVVGLDKTGRSEYGWLAVIIPLISVLVGVVVLVTGVVLARLRRDDQPDHEHDAATEPVLDPAR